jgi:ectoine hydroxylase-related dioxygenase (phytanoyl-CoA dioxygenase family)
MPSPQEIKTFFAENGYYLARGVYSPDEIAELEREVDRIVAQNIRLNDAADKSWKGEAVDRLKVGGTFFTHTHQVHYYSARWLQALLHPAFLDVAEAIIGPDIVLHHTKLLQKPAEKGAPFPMHQDWSYFPSVRDTMIGATIAVTRATDEMGCLRVYSGSHKLGRLTNSGGQSYSEFMGQNYPLERATIIEAEAGDVLFFHYFTIHGSMPNRSAQVRKNVLVQLHAGDDRVEPGNGHVDSRLVLRGWSHITTQAYCEAH